MNAKTAIAWTCFWILLSCLLGAFIFHVSGVGASMTFFTVYLIEKTLSFDNLFVFLLIFSYFKTPENLKQRILTIGIVGAIVFRAVFIFSGSVLFEKFDWLLYGLGAVLIYLGMQLFFGGEDNEEDVADMWAVKFSKKHLRTKEEYFDGKLVTIGTYDNRLYFTMTFMVIVVVEISDIIFAIDSVPAAFAITNDATLIYLANICAILGLRSLYFVMDAFIQRLRFINYGVGLILAFIGAKILLSPWVHIDPTKSMVWVLSVLAITFIISYTFPLKTLKAGQSQ